MTSATDKVSVGDTVRITTGPHAGRIAKVTAVKGPKTVELAVLDEAGRRSFRLWSVKKATLEVVREEG